MFRRRLGSVCGITIAGICLSIANACGSNDATTNGSDSGTPIFHLTDGALSDSGDDGCPESAKLVYVTGVGSKLYSFYPPTKQYTLVGTLQCEGSNAFTPDHMTVDRQGLAWVESKGKLYTASTTDASCTPYAKWTGNATFDRFSLTFIKTTSGIDTTLFLMSGKAVFGSFDTSTGVVTTIRDTGIGPGLGDMTANGDGIPFFLSDTLGHQLYNVNPLTGNVQSVDSLSKQGESNQALAFWGGSFYAFFNDDVYVYNPKTRALAQTAVAPIQITGAGQSTCVPKVSPVPI